MICTKFIDLNKNDSGYLVGEIRKSGLFDDTDLLNPIEFKMNQEMDVMALNNVDRLAEYVNLRLIAQDDSEFRFRVRKTASMAQLKESYSYRHDKPVSHLRFVFDGSRVSDDHTPLSLDMENNDIIEVHHTM